MAALVPEPPGRMAVAVSGGPDSLALTRLLSVWADAHGCRLLAYTVDHGLRTEAASEAHWVNRVLTAWGIAHRILTPDPPLAPGCSQAAARAGRYRALVAACAEDGVGHLALAHQREDQAETVLLRVAADSGVMGLAGMPAATDRDGLRLLRPVLGVPKARLRATVAAHGLGWVDDPTNADPGYARTRMRRVLPALAADGLGVDRLADMARDLGRLRAVMEEARTALIHAAVTVDDAGYAALDPAAWGRPPAPVAREALSRVISVVGGCTRPPRMGRLDALAAAVDAGLTRARTLGGCRIVPHRGRWLVIREPGRTPATPLTPDARHRLDDRFTLTVAASAPAELTAAPLGDAGWAGVCRIAPDVRSTAVPPPVRPALMAVWHADAPVAVPALGWERSDVGPIVAWWAFAPAAALTPGAFTVAPSQRDIMCHGCSA